MITLTPSRPHRPLLWPDFVLDLRELLLTIPQPVYIVGGAVRDALLHRPLHDIDLATPANAVRLARQIANHFAGDIFVLDAERDVGRVLLTTPEGRLTLDVACLRGDTLLDDLQDRDFTINAMAVDAKGDLELLLDPLGGEADIQNKRLRRCSSAALSADPIRVLRAVRQSIQLGLRIEAETLKDVRANTPELNNVSPERVRDEWFKVLALPRPAAALRVADSLGLLKTVLPEVMPLHNFPLPAPHGHDGWQHTLAVVEKLHNIFSVISYTRTDNTASSFGLGMLAIQLDRYRKPLLDHLAANWPNERPHQALLMLAALLHDAGQPMGEDGGDHAASSAAIANACATRLRLSNGEIIRLAHVIQNHRLPLALEDTSPLSIYRFWKRMGEAGIDVCLLALADYLGTYGVNLGQKDWLKVVERVRLLLEAWYEKHDTLVSPPMLVDGNSLMTALALKPGPIIGDLLERIREAQVTAEVQTPEDALGLARTVLENKLLKLL